jgi:hypothetical protein
MNERPENSHLQKTVVDLLATTLFAVFLAPVIQYSFALIGYDVSFLAACGLVYLFGFTISILNQYVRGI